MTIYEKIKEEITASMKNGDIERREALRFLFSEIQKEIVDSQGDRNNVLDDISLKVISKAIKTRKEAIKIYNEQSRQDLAEPEEAQLKVIMEFAPAEMSDEELKGIVDQVKSQNPGVTGMALMGKIMPIVKGKADPERIKSLL